jgi:hypothetical protein
MTDLKTTMDDAYTACGIAEGFIECDDEAKINEAWQYLIDTGLAWSLQGWFGRRAMDLIREGLCRPPSGWVLKKEGTT